MLKQHERARAIEDRFIRLGLSGAFTPHQQDLAEFTWSAGAVRWMLALLLFKKTREYGQKIELTAIDNQSLIADGKALAGTFRDLWLVRNKESELRNVVLTFEKAFAKITAR